MLHKDPPRIVFRANEDAKELKIHIRCGSITAQHSGAVSAGDSVELPLRVPQGTWPCTGKVDLLLTDGGVGEMPLNFQVQVLPALEIRLNPDTQDLKAGHLDVLVNRDVKSFVIEAYGTDGVPVEAASSFVGSVRGGVSVPLDWTPATHEILRFRVRVEDGSGFWAEKNIYPWFIDIPHEDLVFKTNEAKIPRTELPKLDEPWEEILDAVARYGAHAPVKLYVGGFTDTVGTRSSNLALSDARARSLAEWFMTKGFEGEIWYQGFGEDGLKIPTGDEVDEQANRRAVYVIAADPPPVIRSSQRSSWKRLK
jgi:hypothetical protein